MACNPTNFVPQTKIRPYLQEISYHIFSALFVLGREGESL